MKRKQHRNVSVASSDDASNEDDGAAVWGFSSVRSISLAFSAFVLPRSLGPVAGTLPTALAVSSELTR